MTREHSRDGLLSIATLSLLLALALTALPAGCAGTAGDTGAARPDTPTLDLGDPDLSLAEPVRAGNLVVWPVLTTGATADAGTAYLTLDEGFDQGLVEVLETGTVNELKIVNRSDRPLFLMAGEVVDGGRQDRIVSRDLVVAPGTEAPLGSFCVEQSRWSAEAGDETGGTHFKAAKAVVAAPVREAAQVSKAQQAVWSNVHNMNAINGTNNATGTYMALVNDEKVRSDVEARLSRVLAALPDDARAVGVVVRVEGATPEDDMEAAEIFGDAGLWRVLREKLVRAYVLDAVTQSKWAEMTEEDRRAMSATGANGVGQTAQMEGFESGNTIRRDGEARQPRANDPVDDPDLVVDEDQVETGNHELKHLHRTIYKRR